MTAGPGDRSDDRPGEAEPMGREPVRRESVREKWRERDRQRDRMALGVRDAIIGAVLAQVIATFLGLMMMSARGAWGEILEAFAFFMMTPAINQVVYVVPMAIAATRRGHRRYRAGVLSVAGVVFLLTGTFCGWIIVEMGRH